MRSLIQDLRERLFSTTTALAHSSIGYGLYGALFAGASSLLVWSSGILTRRLWTEVDIDHSCEAYRWLQLWLSKRLESSGAPTRCVLELSKDLGPQRKSPEKTMRMSMMTGGEKASANENDLPTPVYMPQVGEKTWFVFEGRWIWIYEVTSSDANQSMPSWPPFQRQSGKRMRVVALFKSVDVITRLVLAARELYQEQLKTHTVIWTAGDYGAFGPQGSWNVLDARPSRPMDTVILEGSIGTEICEDVQQFIDSEAWYYARGVPYRRGYLLYGPPGCGKTSFITALAGELHLVICILNLSSKQLNDDSLLQLMSNAPRHSIILLEDVDAAFKNSGEQEETGASVELPGPLQAMKGLGKGTRVGANATGVTFSGLLNAIDGVAAQEGKLVFMTTNYKDRLDEALVRPGRVDKRVYFGLASRESARRLFERFYDGHASLAERFASEIPENSYSMATIQGHLMNYRHAPDLAVKEVEKLHATAASLQMPTLSVP